MINKNRLIQTFRDLIAIDCLSLQERQMADHLIALFTKLGMTINEDDAGQKLGGNTGNLHAYLPGDLSLPPILFSCHIDTVGPGLGKQAVVHPDGKITSNGDTILGADDFSGVAAILEAIQTLKESSKPHRPIEILFSVAEEIYCRGIGVFDMSVLKSKEAYVLDLAGPVGSAASSAPEIVIFKIKITGRPAHAGFAPQEGIHSIRAAAMAISRMELGHVGADMTVNVGVIEGGSAGNVVPEFCTVKGELRGFNPSEVEEQLKKIYALFEASAKELGATVETQEERVSVAYEIDQTHSAIMRFKAACEQIGVPFSLAPTHGLSDFNALHDYGLRGLTIANAMEKCHSTEEYTTVSELERIANLTLALMSDNKAYSR